jgi:hypothetical protein
MLTTDLAASRLADHLDQTTASVERARQLLAATVKRLDDSEPGYPGGTHGGGTPTDDGPLRSAVVTRDAALADRAKLEHLCRTLDATSRELLHLTHRWMPKGTLDVIPTPVDDIWCVSCRKAGHMTPRRPGNHGDRCRWCADTLRAVNVVRAERRLVALLELPTAAIHHRSAGRRTTARDIEGWAKDSRGRK